MKKYFLILIALLFLAPSAALAACSASTCAAPNSCINDKCLPPLSASKCSVAGSSGCSDYGSGYTCKLSAPVQQGTCTVNDGCKNLEPQNQWTCVPGRQGVCTVDDGCKNFAPANQWKCDIPNRTCVAPTNTTCQAPPSGTCVASTQDSSGSSVGASGTTNGTFVALAPIPGLTQGATADENGIVAFLNNFYRFLIGIAAVLAVIEIIRGGFMIMGQESITKHGEGKEIIQQALLGLALVLAPVLVFTIINPSILNLKLALPPITTHAVSTSGSAAKVEQSIPCSGNDCAAAETSCEKLLEQPDGWKPSTNETTKVCMKDGKVDANHPSGDDIPGFGEVGPQPNPCPPGDTTILQCKGQARDAGSSLAGTDAKDSDITVPFDGTYMDLIKFTGSAAATKAGAYTCQRGDQKNSKPFTCSSSGTDCLYVACIVPQQEFRIVTDKKSAATYSWLKVSPDSLSAYDTYYGECQRMQSELSGAQDPVWYSSFSQTLKTMKRGEESAAKSVTCTDKENELNTDKENPSACFTTTQTCQQPGS